MNQMLGQTVDFIDKAKYDAYIVIPIWQCCGSYIVMHVTCFVTHRIFNTSYLADTNLNIHFNMIY